jgi:hypothetical protein
MSLCVDFIIETKKGETLNNDEFYICLSRTTSGHFLR